MKPFLTLIFVLATHLANAQPGYNPVRGYWDRAGVRAIPVFTQTRDIRVFGADPQGRNSSNAALRAAIADLGGRPGVIIFPAGNYYFDAPVDLAQDSIVLRGDGHDSTRLRFDLAGRLANCITIAGSQTDDTSLLSATFTRGDSIITVENPELFQSGDWVQLSIDDAPFMTSVWAVGTLGQTMQIRGIVGNRIFLESRARFDYSMNLRPRIRRIVPRKHVGIECLAVERSDATSSQTSNIVFDRAVNCSISGIESDNVNFAHVELNRSANIGIRNSYFHDAFAYGGGGQAYGVMLQNGSNECLVSGNYFNHLRHSMLIQSGANGNVLAYNYSSRPYWTGTGLPDSSAGEIVLHGNFPFMNLAEGNVVQNIVIDDSHGANGPLNTFFRNRARGFGIFMNFSPPSDSQQFIGNEVTNPVTGLYFLNGRGHFQYANNYQGRVENPGSIPEASLYLPSGERPECSAGMQWPVIGETDRFNTGFIPAMRRVNAGIPASCGCLALEPEPGTSVAPSKAHDEWGLAPNPAGDFVKISGSAAAESLGIFDATGRQILQIRNPGAAAIGLRGIPPGMYIARIQGGDKTSVVRLIIVH